jgi:Undecaprenyl-phosphate galactose phosphotransferase WbaP
MLKAESSLDNATGSTIEFVGAGSARYLPGGKLKRVLDILVASAGIVVLWPLMLMVALAIRYTDPGPAIFGHERIGLNGRRFKCLKFRSMIINSEAALRDLLERDTAAAAEWAQSQKLKNDPRVTKLGRLLRETSLDELPQLWNVLKGDMSIVGPRPIVSAEVRRYGSDFNAYASTKPGITGLWQVTGRSDCTYDERVSLDVAYVQNWSIVRDVWIIARTIVVVFARKGSY